jgi:hypothetical protein
VILNRQLLQEVYGDIHFLPEEFDDAFLGVVEHMLKNHSLYDMLHVSEIFAEQLDVDRFVAYTQLTVEMAEDLENIALNLPLNKKWFWNAVSDGKIIAWEGLHEAIWGLAKLGCYFPAPVYDENIIIDLLKVGITYSDNTDVTPDVMNAVLQMKDTKFGGKEPFYLKHLESHEEL